MARDNTLLKVALWIGGAFVAYKVAGKVWATLQAKIGAPIADPLARAYVALTQSDAIQSNTQIRLPTGVLVDPARGQLQRVGDVTQFVYNGRTYAIGARNASGVYPAT